MQSSKDYIRLFEVISNLLLISPMNYMSEQSKVIEKMKELLSDPTKKIAMNDFVVDKLRELIEATGPEYFPMQMGNFQQETFNQRVEQYGKLTADLRDIVILLVRWGDKDHLDLVKKIFGRLSENVDREPGGLVICSHLNWYPLHLLMYAAGISALESGKYDVLKRIFETPVQNSATGGRMMPLIIPVMSNMTALDSSFKCIPGRENDRAPRSEFMYAHLGPVIEDILYLGKSFEEIFDLFEIHLALYYAEISKRGVGPIGRFGWKHAWHGADGPYSRVVTDARSRGAEWPPLQAGMFNGSLENFLKIAESFQVRLDKVSWY